MRLGFSNCDHNCRGGSGVAASSSITFFHGLDVVSVDAERSAREAQLN